MDAMSGKRTCQPAADDGTGIPRLRRAFTPRRIPPCRVPLPGSPAARFRPRYPGGAGAVPDFGPTARHPPGRRERWKTAPPRSGKSAGRINSPRIAPSGLIRMVTRIEVGRAALGAGKHREAPRRLPPPDADPGGEKIQRPPRAAACETGDVMDGFHGLGKSVRNGEAGRPSLLWRLTSGLSAHP